MTSIINDEGNESKLLFEMMLEDDECLSSTVYEDVCLTDYDSLPSSLKRVLEAYDNQEVYMFVNDNGDEYIFSQKEKTIALVNYLESITAKLKKTVTEM